MIFDHGGNEIARHQLEHEQILPQAGWVEHNPLEIWERTGTVVRTALNNTNLSSSDLAAVGITNQRETSVVWDKNTGRPLYNAIVWQDTRTDRIASALEREGKGDVIRQKAGLPPATYFSGGKIQWILENVDGVREAAERGDAIFGNTDTWVIWNMTGGVNGGSHITDVTNASRTMLMNLETLDWDDELLSFFNIPRSMLPEIRPSSDPNGYGVTHGAGPLGGEIQLTGDLGDQLGIIRGAEESETLARQVEDNGGVYFVPAFSGLFAPYWRSDARGAIVGLSRFNTNAHIARATLEAICYQSKDVVDAMAKDSGVDLDVLKVDGGVTANKLCMQMQADILGVPVSKPVVAETTAPGAAYAAGLATGFWSGTDELRSKWSEVERWEPRWSDAQRRDGYAGWQKAVQRTLDWVDVE